MGNVYSKQIKLGPLAGAIIMASIFALGGLACLIVGIVLGPDVPAAFWPLIGCGALFVLMAGISIYFGALMRRQAQPTDVAGGADWSALIADLEHRFADTPYSVESTDTTVEIHADLADARFLTLSSVRRVQTAYRLSLALVDDHAVRRVGERRLLHWTAGPDGSWSAQWVGESQVQSGSVHTIEFHREYGVDEQGPRAVVDYTFRSKEITDPVKDALQAHGFSVRRDASTQMGIVMAGLGIAVALGIGIALVVLAFTGGFSS